MLNNEFSYFLAASPDSAAINHYATLMRLDSFAGEFNLFCFAKEHCKVLNVGQTSQCNLCELCYHIDWVFPNLLHREFYFALCCGCDVKVTDEGCDSITIFSFYSFFFFLITIYIFFSSFASISVLTVNFANQILNAISWYLECHILKSRSFTEVRHNS